MKEIDFIPEWYKASQQRKRSYHRQYALIGVLFAVLLLWSAGIGRYVQTVQAEINDIKTANEQGQVRVQAVGSLESELSVLREKAEILESITPRTETSAIIAELSYLVRGNVILKKLSMDHEPIRNEGQKRTAASRSVVQIGDGTKDAAVETTTPVTRVRIVLTGISATPADAAMLISRMEESDYFHEVVPIFTKDQTIRNHNVTEFEIRCYVADYKLVREGSK